MMQQQLTAPALAFLAILALAQLPQAPTSLRVSTTGTYGPQANITCPANAIPITTTTDLQTAITANAAGTTFCVKAGVHVISRAATPRSGDTFIGELGAVLDGTGWVTTDSTLAPFSAQNADVDNVTIRNLVIRNMPQDGIHAFKDFSDGWVIENNELHHNKNGLSVPNSSIVRANYIHHNVGSRATTQAIDQGGGYGGYLSHDVLIEGNEIAFNGVEQKFLETVRVTFRNNFVHDNLGDGIWYDGGNANALIENNRVEDNARNGIFYEASTGPAVIRANTIRHSGDTGVFVSNSRNADTYANVLEDNFRAITYFVDCNRVVMEGFDLSDNSTHDNTIRVGVQAGAFATGISYTLCSPSQITDYHTPATKRLTFTHNSYDVPTLTGAWWLWNGPKTFTQWQALGHDTTGSIF